MNSPNWSRVGAVAAMVGGVLIVGHEIPYYLFDRNSMNLDSLADYLGEVIFGAGYAALLILFVALLRLQAGRRQIYGRLGRVGIYVALLGCVFVMVKTSLIVGIGVTFGVKTVMDIRIVIFGLYMAGTLFASLLGPVLLGVDALRARVLQRWLGLALVVVPLAIFVVQLVSSTLASYSLYVEGPFWVAMGYGLWSYGSREETMRPAQHQPAVAE